MRRLPKWAVNVLALVVGAMLAMAFGGCAWRVSDAANSGRVLEGSFLKAKPCEPVKK